MRLRSIREVSRLTGFSEGALRYYNERGVVTPTVKEKSGRKRWLYDDEAVDRLKKLFMLKYLRLSISDISRVLDGEPGSRRLIERQLEVLKAEREKIDTKILILKLLAAEDACLFSGDEELTEAQKNVLGEMLAEFLRKGEVR